MTTPDLRAETDGSGRAQRPLLEAKGLYKSYGEVDAVSGVDFALDGNSYVTLLGPSGCGKTSILRMIGGFEEITSGALTLDGARLDEIPAARRPINTVFQSYALFPHLSVLDNVAFGLSYRGIPRSRIRPTALEALKTVRMEAMADRRPRQLSGGQQQRVALARAIVNEPRLLLLDEPLSALDRRMRKDMQIELKDLQRRLGMTFLHVTHDQEEAFALSDRIIVMRNGRIEQQGRPDHIYARPNTAYVADFIGGAVCVPGEVVDRQAVDVILDTALGRFQIPGAPPLTAGMAAVLCLRPENLSLASDGLPARVTHCVYRGSDWIVECESAGQLLQATALDTPPPPGSDVKLSFDPARAWAAAAEQGVSA
ncbi:ABC transporter ATP-binding protein [Tropicimonas sediminicola]|uniref:Spermidine/putrescine transport system ATP-binding protein n=1 Tax=Tropicimonas sediminicola TaxID=1031541 RepID=A0A239LEB7_9RHOB|nr:ABC transporter ATP-binding protein [Tropicimonas sediminicola]SNT28183.1 spermidine/putrescine transport system ATP-binding protein [Tropicimonas sediminicola]